MLTKKQKIKKIKKQFLQKIKGRHKYQMPVFIFGEQRSGTNMLINTLNHSIDTDCYFETDDKAFDNYQLRDCKTIQKIINDSYARCVIFKAISDSQKAKFLLDTFTEAKGIWIYRSYPDVINSSLKNFTDHYKSLELILKNPVKAAWRAENITRENMQLIKEQYDRKISDASSRGLIWYLRNYQFFQQKLDSNPRILMVKYECLVSEPAKFFKPIFDFLQIAFKETYVKEIFSGSVKKGAGIEIDSEIEKLCQAQFHRLNLLFERTNTLDTKLEKVKTIELL